MASLFDEVRRFCFAQGLDKTYWVAYSGGLDSHVLLHTLAALAKHHPISVKAVYVHHGLSPNASAWAAHCAAVCRELGVDFIQKNLCIDKKTGESIEALAREARYLALQKLMTENSVLVTGHHQDDQAETLLLQLIRGSGLKGLSAMPIVKPFAKGVHGRPFLMMARATMQAYAEKNQLTWIEDESNHERRLARNFLRHEIFPLLKTRWPSVTATLTRAAEHCAEAQAFVDQVIHKDLDRCLSGADGIGLSVTALQTFSSTRQRHILREWLARKHYPIPPVAKMQAIQTNGLQAATDRFPCITWGGVELRRYQDVLYVMKCLVAHDTTKRYGWRLDTELRIPGVGRLQAHKANLVSLKLGVQQVEVRFRQGGEVCRLPGRACHHALKKLFQQWKIPPWLRSRTPLLFVGEELVAVPGYYLHQDYISQAGEESWSLSLLPY